MSRRPRRLPRLRPVVASPASVVGRPGDLAATERAVQVLAASVEQLATESVSSVDVDLEVGTNRIAHGLGRRPVRVAVIPATADATFAWGWNPTQPANPHPERTADLVVAGAAMTARVLFW